jgi:lysophospholipase L1-like esterase
MRDKLILVTHNVELHNVVELLDDRGANGVRLSRIPNKLRLSLNEKAQRGALNGVGMEIRFNLEDEEAVIVLQREPFEGIIPKSIFEVFQGGFQSVYATTPQVIGNGTSTITVKRNDIHLAFMQQKFQQGQLHFDSSLIRVLLPLDSSVRLLHVEGKVSPPRPNQVPSLRCIAYGSSITAGFDVAIPSGGYAFRMANLLGVDLLNLGFAGGCYLEEAMADYIAERTDWDFAILELGINVIGTMTLEQFERKVDYFLSQVAGKNPNKWVFCMDIFTCYRDFNEELLVKQYRNTVLKKVEELNLPYLVYFLGTELLTEMNGLTIDLLHPSTQGMHEIAENLARRIKNYLSYHI